MHRIFIKEALSKHLEMTEENRHSKARLLFCFVKQRKHASVNTLSIDGSGVHIIVQPAKLKRLHGKAAATSATKMAKVGSDIILYSTGWSKDFTFVKFYHKQVQHPEPLGPLIV